MIILKANAGLCNKLLAIGSGLHLAKDIGCRLHVVWATDVHMSALFTELFEPVPDFTLHEFRIPNSSICRAVTSRMLPLLFSERRGVEKILLHEKKFLESCRKRPSAIWRFSSCWEFYPANDFSWLKPKSGIADRINNFSRLTEGCAFGLHIRRGDHVDAMKCSPLHLFYAKISELICSNPEVRIFLCTDDPRVKKDLCNLYPKHIVTRESVLSRYEKGGVADALVDLWLLSNCRKIYGTYPSSFSLVASRIGKTEFEWVRDETRVGELHTAQK